MLLGDVEKNNNNTNAPFHLRNSVSVVDDDDFWLLTTRVLKKYYFKRFLSG